MSHHPTAVVEDSKTIQLTKRIRVLIQTTGLSRLDCFDTIMSSRNPPTVEEFHLAYTAAVMLTESPITQRDEQRYSEDLNLGLPVE